MGRKGRKKQCKGYGGGQSPVLGPNKSSKSVLQLSFGRSYIFGSSSERLLHRSSSSIAHNDYSVIDDDEAAAVFVPTGMTSAMALLIWTKTPTTGVARLRHAAAGLTPFFFNVNRRRGTATLQWQPGTISRCNDAANETPFNVMHRWPSESSPLLLAAAAAVPSSSSSLLPPLQLQQLPFLPTHGAAAEAEIDDDDDDDDDDMY